MSTDLEDAIAWARAQMRYLADANVARGYYTLLADAAEKHLATLPKPVWRVKAWGPTGGAYAIYERDNRAEAASKAAQEFALGARMVEIIEP
jgi:hypothetical protein